MKMKMLTAALGALAILGTALPAAAQVERNDNLSLKAGVFFPGSSDASDESDLWFGLGAEYRLDFRPNSVTPGDFTAHTTLSLDWFSSGDWSVMPLMFNYVARPGNEWFYQVGAGLAWTDFGGGGNDSEFVFNLGVGYNFSQGTSPAYIEARWISVTDTDASGLALMVGTRF